MCVRTYDAESLTILLNNVIVCPITFYDSETDKLVVNSASSHNLAT
jgi:hypothetical protein